MKIDSSNRRRAAGYALLIVLSFAAVSLIILGGTMNRTSSVVIQNERNNQFVQGEAAAEAASEKALAQLIEDYQDGADNLVMGNIGIYQTNIPNSTETSYWNNFVFSDAMGNNNRTYVSRTVAATTNLVALGFDYTGLSGYVSTYRIISNARLLGSRYPITNAVQQDVQTAAIPLFQFAIFYNSLLEFTTAATMTVRGPVHANNDIYVGSSSALTFNSTVTATGSVLKTSPWAGSSSFAGAITYGVTPVTNHSTLSLPIGTNNTASAVREVINPPPAGESVGSAMGTNRYYNKAQLNIMVSNTTVKAWVKTDISDTSSNIVPWTNLNIFISTNVTFTDQREGKTVLTSQIDVGKLSRFISTNTIFSGKSVTTNKPLTVYVADYRTATSTTLPSVRLTNGTVLPAGGLTVATPNPLYVMGNYNTPSGYTLGSTNTSAVAPASFLSDAITILSPTWDDTKSASSYTTRSASDTTVNAAIVAGNVASTGSAQSQYSGGVHNLTRLLEDWSSDTLTLNTSIVNLYTSVRATNQFVYPVSGNSATYYMPPSRNFNFDNNFTNPAKQPPGTPMLRALIRLQWATPPANTTNYAGT